MATDLDGSNYSELDASNSNASPNGMPEGMAPSGVNDAWRQGMGATKRAWDRDHAGTWVTVGGTGNAITLAYTTAPTALIQGQKHAFKVTAANSDATTVKVGSLAAKNLYKRSGSGVVACTGGELQAGDIVEIEFDGTQYQLLSQAANAACTGLPSGMIMPFAGPSAPTGFLSCDGSAISRTTYAGLFTAIGTAWGTGDGTTTFNLPDLRGKTLIGAGTGSGLTARTLGTSGGAETVTSGSTVLAASQIPAHTHGFNVTSGTESAGHTHSGVDIGQQAVAGGGGTLIIPTSFDGPSGAESNTHTHNVTGTTDTGSGGGLGHTHTAGTMQPFGVALYVIKT